MDELGLVEPDHRLWQGVVMGVEDGGHLVPAEMRAAIMAKAGTLWAVRGQATVIPTTSNHLRLPAFKAGSDATELSAWQADWISETQPLNEADPELESFEVSIFKLRLSPLKISRDLAEDAPFLLSYISALQAQHLAITSDLALLNGSGVGRSRGVLQSGVPRQRWARQP